MEVNEGSPSETVPVPLSWAGADAIVESRRPKCAGESGANPLRGTDENNGRQMATLAVICIEQNE